MIIKYQTGIILAAASVLALSVPAQASKLTPGLYSANGQQEICLVSDGSWYSPTFGGWGGIWYNISGSFAKSGLLGNYSSGVGNDNMNMKGSKLIWTEWQDDLSYTNVIIGSWTRSGDSCGARHVGRNRTKNPAQQ